MTSGIFFINFYSFYGIIRNNNRVDTKCSSNENLCDESNCLESNAFVLGGDSLSLIYLYLFFLFVRVRV